MHAKSSTNRIKGDKNGLVVHGDLKCKPNHNKIDICIEHLDIVRVHNPIKRRERWKITGRSVSQKTLKVIPYLISSL